MSAEDFEFVSHLPQIKTSEDAEYEAWARTLGTDVSRVREAVATVGHSADAVRDYLARV